MSEIEVQKIKCDHCGADIQAKGLSAHKKTKKCMNFGKEVPAVVPVVPSVAVESKAKSGKTKTLVKAVEKVVESKEEDDEFEDLEDDEGELVLEDIEDDLKEGFEYVVTMIEARFSEMNKRFDQIENLICDGGEDVVTIVPGQQSKVV